MIIALGILALFVAIAVHELGHLLPGLAMGYPFAIFAAGSLLAEATPAGGVRIRWNRDPLLIGGIAGTTPNRVDGIRWRMALIVAGGPVASLVLALAAASVLGWLPLPAGALRSGVQWLRLLSAALFVASAVPVANGPFVTDGKRFLRLVSRGPLGDREVALLTVGASSAAGVRPKDWDRGLLARGLLVRDGSLFEMQMHVFAYLRSIDAGDVADAKVELGSAVTIAERLPGTVAGGCLLEAACFEAAHGEGARRARQLLERVPRQALGVSEADRQRAEASIACAECDRVTAGAAIDRALAACPANAAGPRAWLLSLRDSITASATPGRA